MNLSFCEKTSIGKVRKRNEDSFGSHRHEILNAHIFCLADGMGGYAAGDMASQIVVESVIKDFCLLKEFDLDPEILMDRFFNNAQDRLRQYKANHDIARFGTTLSILLFLNNMITCANIGDTRIYTFIDNLICQESVDHTLVNDLVQKGEISVEDSVCHIQQHILTKALSGERGVVTPYLKTLAYERGKVFLIASDGLYRMVDEKEVISILMNVVLEEEVVDQLIDKALANGGKDNVTVQLITCR